MEMARSKTLDKLRAGEPVCCTKLNLSDHRAAQIAAMCGIDCIWLDMEHVANSISQIEAQILAAKAYGADSLVRVGRGSYSDHVRALEAGASGIMVPHVMGLEDAKAVVRMARFHPIGRRPVDSGNTDGAFCMVDFQDYIKQANERCFLCIQIEDPEPMAELDAICSLDGIDIVFFGPSDFSQGIGKPGDFANPELLRARELVAQCCARHGKFAGTVGSLGNLESLWGMGYKFVAAGADVLCLADYFKGIRAGFDAAAQRQ